MTGMKEGAGENPFASDESDTPDIQEDTDNTEAAMTREPANERTTQSVDIPYKFRRDGVQDGRNRVPLFLQPDTKDDEREALREMETRFGDDVSLTDLREAVLMAGLENLDDVEATLEEWGYGMTFDE